MKTSITDRLGIMLAAVLAIIGVSAKADTFGSGANAFTIDFVNIGNLGNPANHGGIGNQGLGRINYLYRLGTYEISQDFVTKATALGMKNVESGPFTGNKPAGRMTWYEAAAFVNWLNTISGHQRAYNLN